MKTKILNYFTIIYEVFKQDFWPYRYYYLLLLLFLTTFTCEMLTINRIIRFIITCLILIIYKKVHDFMEKNKENLWSNFNIKYLLYIMWINIIQNPILYITWKWDIYIYYKLENYINKNIKNKNYYKIVMLLIWNISLPIKIIYIRFYIALNIIKKLTLKDFMFNRIYGFIVSILIFSDIIKYVYALTGGFIYLIIYIYIIMYSINIIYTVYNYFIKKNKDKKQIFNSLKIKNIITKTRIYKICEDYFDTLKIIEINKIYEYRINASIIGTYIINCKGFINNLNKDDIIMYLNSIIYKIPEQWRFCIYSKILLFQNIFYISYKERETLYKLTWTKLSNILKQDKCYTYMEKYYNTYMESIDSLLELFIAFESILYYKYYVLKKGVKNIKDLDNIKNLIDINEYEYIYKFFILILKNILFYIWSFEYYIYQDKNKLTKLYVIEDITLEFGYHIYPKDKNNFNVYDNFEIKVLESDLILNKNTELYNSDYEIINENIYLLERLVDLSGLDSLVYIAFKNNYEVKKIINKLYKKYLKLIKLNTDYDNNVLLLKTEVSKEYFMELKYVINALYKEWESAYMNKNNIIEIQRVVFEELIEHCKLKINEI